jgi:hypothetical protein
MTDGYVPFLLPYRNRQFLYDFAAIWFNSKLAYPLQIFHGISDVVLPIVFFLTHQIGHLGMGFATWKLI